MKKNIIVISGHSGVGKSTLIKHILKTFSNVKLSISCTTRSPRSGEKDGREYYFLTQKEFEEQIKANAFVEYTKCFGNYYGTLKSEIRRILNDGVTCILDIEFAGAYNVLVKHVLGNDINCTGILIEPPSIDELKRRLIGRGETMETTENRLKVLEQHDYYSIYQYRVLNDDLDKAKNSVTNIVENIFHSQNSNSFKK